MEEPTRKVEIVAYNPAWPGLFSDEADRLRHVLVQEVLTIHHIGSTSVPGLRAKPIIDVLVEVRDIERIDRLNSSFISAGYLPKGEYGIAGRRYFVRETELQHTHHIHMFASGHPDIGRNLRFRDYLRSHPEVCRAYEDLILALVRCYPTDPVAYQYGKDALIMEIDAKALAWFYPEHPG